MNSTDGELSHSLAIQPDAHGVSSSAPIGRFAPLTRRASRYGIRAAPGAVWAVNITGDGRLVIAAYGDGTIRWHRMDDGRELLALQVLNDKTNWVAWTPEGFYDATPGAFGVLQMACQSGARRGRRRRARFRNPQVETPGRSAIRACRNSRPRGPWASPIWRPPASTFRRPPGLRWPRCATACARHRHQRVRRQGDRAYD